MNAEAPPFTVPLSAFTHVRSVFGRADAARMPMLLNAAVVGLAEPVDDADDTEGTPPRCVGLALVRSVDTAASPPVLYLLAPAAAPEATTLLLGRIQLPAALLSATPNGSPYLSPWTLGAEGTGGGTQRSRNNLLRQGAAGRREDV